MLISPPPAPPWIDVPITSVTFPTISKTITKIETSVVGSRNDNLTRTEA